MGAYDSELYAIGYRFRQTKPSVKSDVEIEQDKERAKLRDLNNKIMRMHLNKPWTETSTCFIDFEAERAKLLELEMGTGSGNT